MEALWADLDLQTAIFLNENSPLFFRLFFGEVKDVVLFIDAWDKGVSYILDHDAHLIILNCFFFLFCPEMDFANLNFSENFETLTKYLH